MSDNKSVASVSKEIDKEIAKCLESGIAAGFRTLLQRDDACGAGDFCVARGGVAACAGGSMPSVPCAACFYHSHVACSRSIEGTIKNICLECFDETGLPRPFPNQELKAVDVQKLLKRGEAFQKLGMHLKVVTPVNFKAALIKLHDNSTPKDVDYDDHKKEAVPDDDSYHEADTEEEEEEEFVEESESSEEDEA
jgi:hypothetical protein